MKFFLKMFLVAVAVASGYVIWLLNQPYGGFVQPVFADFPRGTSTSAMASDLAGKGVIKRPWVFLAARAFHRGRPLQAGEYKFDHPATPLEVVSRLVRGDIFYMEVLIPEGYNLFEIAKTVSKLGTIPEEVFLAAARSPALIKDLDPRATSLEGYLFPNKYRIYRHTTAQQLCKMMTAEFRAQWALIGQHADVHRTVTLASLVEREARRPEERPRVASVFSNRIRTGMKLDCDPTTVYAALLEGRYRGTIYRSDLQSLNAYNTYQHAGLPPGPIANPGRLSLQAALAPESTNFLYFVAKGDGSGGHYFAETLARHEANVAVYRSVTHK